MSILVIGAGGVASVAVHKLAMNKDITGEIHLASRTKSKCDAIQKSVKERTGQSITTHEIDAHDVDATADLIRKTHASVLVNLALPYQDLDLMEACLIAKCNYLDTANYEPPDDAKFEYHWQWAYQEKFEKAGLTAILGSGFDPGVTSVFAKYIRDHYLDEIHTIDILDCNGGDHGHPFATNFNPEINIREVTAPARHWEGNKWQESPAMSHKVAFDFPEVGEKNMYLMYHEELESLTAHFPEIKRARFWMTFGDAYINHVQVLENVGMTGIHPIDFEGKKIVPLQFLKAVLPNPSDLGERTKGKTCIGDIITGTKNGEQKTYYIYNVCDHESCFKEVGSQAVSYTTGVPAMIGTAQFLKGNWQKPGVWNMEQLPADDFMNMLNDHGLPWVIKELPNPVDF